MKTLNILMVALILGAAPLWAQCGSGCDKSKSKGKCCCKQCGDPCPNKDCKCPSCPSKK